MVSRNKIVTIVTILLLLSVLFSGCAGEKKILSAPESRQKEAVDVSSQNVIPSSEEENIPEIRIVSFSSIFMSDNSDNENIFLFSWENVPGNESNRLLSFLKNDLQIDWVDNAQITKDEENKIIRVFRHGDSIEIMLYTESAYLKIGDRAYDLAVRYENATHNVYDRKYKNKYDISERYYAVYNLSIKNNGSGSIYVKLNGLRLHEGDRIFNITILEPYNKNSSLLEVLQDLENENKIQDTILLPGQSLNGTVAFRVNSLYNKSFLLKYNTTNVTSASFGKSIEALEEAEYFNYSAALGIPPYNLCHLNYSYEPIFNDECGWANWVNRSIFEVIQKSDIERMRKSTSENIPLTEMVYAVRVIPERNITSPVTTRYISPNLLVIDDTGEEIINKSRIEQMAVLSDQTYKFKSRLGMNFSYASLVQISFKASYITRIPFSGTFWETGRLNFINQDVILDDKLNIIVVRYYPSQMHIG